MVQIVIQTARLLLQIVQLVRLRVRIGRGSEVRLLLLFELRGQLEDFLVLLLLRLVADRKLAFGILDALPGEPALVLRSSNLVANPLHLEVFLADLLFCFHDIAIR